MHIKRGSAGRPTRPLERRRRRCVASTAALRSSTSEDAHTHTHTHMMLLQSSLFVDGSVSFSLPPRACVCVCVSDHRRSLHVLQYSAVRNAIVSWRALSPQRQNGTARPRLLARPFEFYDGRRLNVRPAASAVTPASRPGSFPPLPSLPQ